MPTPDTPPAAVTTTSQVEIEAVAWVSKFVGGDGSTRQVFHESLRAGDTVRKVLRRLSGRFPQLHKALWDPETGALAEHIEVLVNDAVLDISHTLESPLQKGDRLSLIGQYLGG
jgi:molybdopterin converting factor small subunit